MVVTVKYRKYVRILCNDLSLYKLAKIVKQCIGRSLYVCVGVEAEDCFSVAVLCKHIVHPVDFILIDVPAHIHNYEILPTFAYKVIMSLVIHIRTAVCRL